MNWQKLGVCFNTQGQRPWMVSYACTPTALYLSDRDLIRVFFAPRNADGQSIPTFFDCEAADPTQIRYLHDAPILPLGELGTFDDGGIMPCSITEGPGGTLYLYYVGWNPSVSVAYRNAIGLAVSHDGGGTFERPYPGAVIDRSLEEPFFTASPCGMYDVDRGLWHMWYASGTGFKRVNGKVEPIYVLKYARSADGVRWERFNEPLFAPAFAHESTARPTVLKDGETFKMWFCYRGTYDFRDGKDAYRIGYAESSDGRHWLRMDDRAGITYGPTGSFDATMQTYPNAVETPHGRYLFYNGNGFGRTGIGVARWTKNTAP